MREGVKDNCGALLDGGLTPFAAITGYPPVASACNIRCVEIPVFELA